MKVTIPIPLKSRTSVRLPLFSSCVEAGFPSPVDFHLERFIDLNEELIGNHATTFCVRVRGESMRDAGIHFGDVLIIDRSLTPIDRQIIVAIIEGEFTVKRYRKRGENVFLEAENPAFKPIEITEDLDFMVWGVVTYTIHKNTHR